MRTLVTFAFSATLAFGACDQTAASPTLMVPLPGHPFGVAASKGTDAGCWLFVSIPSGQVVVLHRDNGRVEVARTIQVGPQPTGLVVTHDGKTLIVAAGSSVLFLDTERLISGKSDPLVDKISDGAVGSIYANVTADDKFLFVSDESAEAISVIDLAHGRKRIGTIPVGIAPIALTFSRDQRYLYTTSELARPDWKWPNACPQEGGRGGDKIAVPEGAIVVVDVARAESDPKNAIVSKVPAACSPVRMAMSPGGDRIYVTARGSNSILVFDVAKLIDDPSHARLASATVGPAPVPVAVVNGGKHIIVGNSNRFDSDQSKAQQLDVLAADPLRLVGHIPAGSFPRETCLSSDGNTLFVTNFSSDSLEVIDLKRALNQ